MKDFSIYVNSAEKLEQIKRRKRFYRRYRIFLGMLIVLTVSCIFVLYYNRTFDSFERVKTIAEDYATIQNVETYRDGILKYGENQIEYYDKNGEQVWSKSYSISKPQIKVCDNYVLAADIEGRKLYMYDEKGNNRTLTVPYNIIDAEVANQGVVAVALSAKQTNYIELYNLDGDKLVSIKTSMGENGYPLDIALSPNGQMLCASYFIVDGVEMKNRLTFYDFSEDGEKTENILGGYDYNNTLVPTVAFMGSDTICAFGDDRVSVYSVGKRPRLKKETTFDSSIKSIAYDEEHFAIVRAHYANEKDSNYTLDIFSKNGNLVGQCGIDGDYTDITLRRDEIIFTSPYHCAVYTSSGKNIWNYKFKKHLLQILPSSENRNYFIEYEDRLDLIRLK